MEAAGDEAAGTEAAGMEGMEERGVWGPAPVAGWEIREFGPLPQGLGLGRCVRLRRAGRPAAGILPALWILCGVEREAVPFGLG